VVIARRGGQERGRNGPGAAGNRERPPGMVGLTSRSPARSNGFKEGGICASPDGRCWWARRRHMRPWKEDRRWLMGSSSSTGNEAALGLRQRGAPSGGGVGPLWAMARETVRRRCGRSSVDGGGAKIEVESAASARVGWRPPRGHHQACSVSTASDHRRIGKGRRGRCGARRQRGTAGRRAALDSSEAAQAAVAAKLSRDTAAAVFGEDDGGGCRANNAGGGWRRVCSRVVGMWLCG
jgi:hypothetical protein